VPWTGSSVSSVEAGRDQQALREALELNRCPQ
jgi:hypothetical protein